MMKKVLLGFVAGGLLVVFCALSSYAALLVPQVTKLRLTGGAGSTAVPAGHYIVLPNATEGLLTPLSKALFLKPTQSNSNSNADNAVIIANAFEPGNNAVQGPSTMFGISTGSCFGMLLMDVTEANVANCATPPLVTNHTSEFLGAANYPTGPVKAVNLSASLTTGTELEVTIDLNGHIPHFVGILGADATVTYNAAGDGTLVITAKTIDTKSEHEDTLTSTFGFCINSNTTLFGNTALRLIGQTNIWVGDFNLFMPSSDSYSAQGVSGLAGTWGTSNALAGFTAWGPTGASREASIFIPDDSVDDIFGPGVSNSMLTGLVNNSQVSTTVTTGTNFGVSGRTYVFNYTFASGKDDGIGVGAGDTGINHHRGWYDCAIATASYGTPMAEEIKTLSTFRDEYLLTNKLGRTLVSTYERISPSVADFIRDKEALKAVIRTGLKPLVKVADHLTSQ